MGSTSLAACLESYKSGNASERPVNPDPGTPTPPEEPVPLHTEDLHVAELDMAIRAECAGIYQDIRAFLEVGSTPLASTANDILSMA